MARGRRALHTQCASTETQVQWTRPTLHFLDRTPTIRESFNIIGDLTQLMIKIDCLSRSVTGEHNGFLLLPVQRNNDGVRYVKIDRSSIARTTIRV